MDVIFLFKSEIDFHDQNVAVFYEKVPIPQEVNINGQKN